jgi:hypothetical protein
MSALAIVIMIPIICSIASKKKTIEQDEFMEDVTSSRTPEIEYLYPGGTIERDIEGIFIKEMGEKANWEGNPQRLIEISVDSFENKKGYAVVIEYRLDNMLTTKETRINFIYDAKLFYKALYKSRIGRKIDYCWLNAYARLIDEYGREEVNLVAQIRLSYVTAQKINWDNMLIDMFERLLIDEERFYIHPALYR